MDDCIFCKIIKKEIPSYKIYEDEDVYAFLDLSQATEGHTLLIPKKHVTDIFELDEQTAGKLFSRVPKLARSLEKAFPAIQGINILNNNRAAAYQSVFHAHIHLIPRYGAKDDFSIHFGNHQEDYTSDQMTALAKKIEEQVEK